MAALTPFQPVQDALRSLDIDTYRAVGWALMLQLARAQLERHLSVVLDGMARDGEVQSVRTLAAEVHADCVVVLTSCDDITVQRSRIVGRRRDIPGWHELTWAHVERARQSWTPPRNVDVAVDTTRPLDENITLLSPHLVSAPITRSARVSRAGGNSD
jgi:hypothetical protein